MRRQDWRAFALGAAITVATIVVGQALWFPRSAQAQIPDSGAQRNEMVRELQESNRKLAEMTKLLRDIRDDARERDKRK